jgi:hypothetical protein
MPAVQTSCLETTATAYPVWFGRSSKTPAGFEKATLHEPQVAATGPKRLSGCDNLIIQNLGGSRILQRPINVTMEMIDDSFVASFSRANINASGDTLDEALFNLASLIDDLWRVLSENRHRLGPGPAHQYAVLQQHISA